MTSPTIKPPPAASSCLGTASAYEQITQRIIALMEAGTVPWQKPWKVLTGMPRNLISKRHYRGINLLMLLASDFESPLWLTLRQANGLGGHVRKGERATPVVFWKQLKKSNDPEENLPPDESKPDPTERKRPRIVARLYSVFNVVQCEGLSNFPSLPDQLGTLPEPAKVYENMPDRPVIKHGMRSAFYSPMDDVVGLPTLTRFSSEAEYFSTLWHELCHASGSEKRLNRPSLTASAGFGSDPYCKEELIAELGAAFLCAHVGIAERTLNNSAAYIKNWIDRLKNDKTLIVSAAAQAQQATDYILGTQAASKSTEGIQPE